METPQTGVCNFRPNFTKTAASAGWCRRCLAAHDLACDPRAPTLASRSNIINRSLALRSRTSTQYRWRYR